MNLNKEIYTKSEFILSSIFFAYFIILAVNLQNIISTYLFVVAGFTIANIILVLVLLFVSKSKDIKYDERDKNIESKSYRNAYFCLIVLINVMIIFSILNDNILQPVIAFNFLFATLFISHIVLNLTKIFYYKRGI